MNRIVRAASLLRWTLGLALLAAGCAEPEPPGDPPLQRGDVENLDEGDAVGSTFAGRYTLTSFDLTRCGCREGAVDCGTVELAADAIAIEQDDGLLAATGWLDGELVPEVEFTGGVDADGAFRMGGVLEATDELGDPIGVTLQLVAGTFDGEGGFDGSWSTRVEAILEGGTSIDCDVDFETQGERTDE